MTVIEFSKSENISINGLDIEIRQAGKGRTVLFLHPGDGVEGDNSFLDDLAKQFHVIAPSHPGFGRSQLPTHFRNMDDLSYFYLDLIEQLNLNNIIVMGASFGGWIAAEIAIKNCSRIAGLVMVDALGVKFGSVKEREITDLFALPLYEQAPLLYHQPERKKVDYASMPEDQLLRIARNHESLALYSWSPTLHNPKLVSRLHRIKVPTQFIWGKNDRVVSPEYGRNYSKAIAGSSFTLIDNVGHYPHIEAKQAFIQTVVPFIDQVPALNH